MGFQWGLMGFNGMPQKVASQWMSEEQHFGADQQRQSCPLSRPGNPSRFLSGSGNSRSSKVPGCYQIHHVATSFLVVPSCLCVNVMRIYENC